MSQRNVYQRLGSRIAGEMQLLAEEKWIIDALNKLKQQRNSLQIERLHLENLKAQLKSSAANESQSISKPNNLEDVSSSAINIMQHANATSSSCFVEVEVVPYDRDNNEVTCNEEELNLNVTQPIFSKSTNIRDYCIEEDDSDDEGDNVAIDINMLMHGEKE